jgi:3-methyladenine DNA glycosylase AlkD
VYAFVTDGIENFTRQGYVADTFRVTEMLLSDDHDMVQKATGGWVREAGKRDRRRLLSFLDRHAATMLRTALRYAIEHLNIEQQAHCLSMNKATVASQDQGEDRS